MKPVRVLLTVDSIGGAWQYGIDLALGLSHLGVETVLAAIGFSPSPDQIRAAAAIANLELVDTGIALGWLAEEPAVVEKAAEAIARLARCRRVDLVQLDRAALAGAARFETPVVVLHQGCAATWWEAVHASPLPADFAWRANLVRAGLEAADLVVAPTLAFGRAVQACYSLAEAPRIVHTGRTPITTGGAAQHDFVFTAGRLWDRGKNLSTIDAAAAGLAVPVRAAGPVAAPDGAQVMFDNIHCLGTLGQKELARWFAARPVFVSAALYEPFGIPVLEAAAAGCALILSDIATFRELWDECAIFLPACDEAAFTDAIGALVGDDFERAVLGRAARERARRYSPDAMASQMAALYRALLPRVDRPVLAAARAA